MSTSRSRPRGKAKVLIVDDHPLVRDGLAAHLEQEPDVELCGQADSLEQAMIRIRADRPDVVLLDLALGQEDGLALLPRMQAIRKEIPVLVLSNYREDVYGERVLRAGAMGFINKDASWEQIVAAIRMVLRGKRYVSAALAERLLEQAFDNKRSRRRGTAAGRRASLVDSLTDRELTVFRLLGEGLTTRQIAQQLFVSAHTIDSHRENIKRRLKLANGDELKRLAILWVAEER